MNLFRRPASFVWFVLMAATVITTWVLSKDVFAARIGTVAIVVIAAFKLRLVLLHFMELRDAPKALRLVFEIWVMALAAAVIGLYLAAV